MSPRANKKYCTVTPPLPAMGDNEEKEAVVVGTSQEEKGKGWMVNPASWLLKGDRKKKEQKVVKSQTKGTGYSSYQNKGWDVKAYMAAQKEKEKQIQLVLENICSELKKICLLSFG